MALADILGGGIGLFAIVAVVILAIWLLSKLNLGGGIWWLIKLPFIAVWWIISLPFRAIGWFFKQITGIGKGSVELGKDIARYNYKYRKWSQRGKDRKEREKAKADELAGTVDEQKQLVSNIISTLGDSTATAEQKSQALVAFYDNVNGKVREMKKIVRVLRNEIKDDITESKRVVRIVNTLLKRAGLLQKQVLKEVEQIKKMGGTDTGGATLVSQVQTELRPVEQQIKALEGQERSKLDLATNVLKSITGFLDDIKDTIKACEKISKEGEFGPVEIQTLTSNLRKLSNLEDSLQGAARTLSKIEDDLIAEEEQVLSAEGKATDSIAKLTKKTLEHKALLAELAAKKMTEAAQAAVA